MFSCSRVSHAGRSLGILIGNNITIEAKAADAVDTSWYDNRTEGQTEFTITTAAQLRGLAELVNKNEDIFSECKIKLGKDIDLNNEQWTPIGNGYEFNGEFDGQGHTIYNLKESEQVFLEWSREYQSKRRMELIILHLQL